MVSSVHPTAPQHYVENDTAMMKEGGGGGGVVYGYGGAPQSQGGVVYGYGGAPQPQHGGGSARQPSHDGHGGVSSGNGHHYLFTDEEGRNCCPDCGETPLMPGPNDFHVNALNTSIDRLVQRGVVAYPPSQQHQQDYRCYLTMATPEDRSVYGSGGEESASRGRPTYLRECDFQCREHYGAGMCPTCGQAPFPVPPGYRDDLPRVYRIEYDYPSLKYQLLPESAVATRGLGELTVMSAPPSQAGDNERQKSGGKSEKSRKKDKSASADKYPITRQEFFFNGASPGGGDEWDDMSEFPAHSTSYARFPKVVYEVQKPEVEMKKFFKGRRTPGFFK